ncbi:MAG: hypothetical protein KBE04_00380 [Phycisphaerae bacterium]|nr:hypothetical protein [Phycisphaerae bacterium]
MELLLSLVISAMVMGAALAVHQRMQQAALAVLGRIRSPSIPSEVFQLIREDLDQVTASPGTRILIDNKREKGYPVARLILRKTITDKKNAEQVFEEIIWQATYDIATDRVTLYRSHSGLALEDRLLDRRRRSVEAQYPFIPVCGGLTTFTVRAPQGVNLLERWASPALPTGVEVTMSFADPIRTPQGELAIPESDQITRMIAVDAMRMVRFEVVAPDANAPGQDGNAPAAGAQRNATGQDPRRPGSRSGNAVPTR